MQVLWYFGQNEQYLTTFCTAIENTTLGRHRPILICSAMSLRIYLIFLHLIFIKADVFERVVKYPLPFYNEIAPCPCDLTFNKCDTQCCCDQVWFISSKLSTFSYLLISGLPWGLSWKLDLYSRPTRRHRSRLPNPRQLFIWTRAIRSRLELFSMH